MALTDSIDIFELSVKSENAILDVALENANNLYRYWATIIVSNCQKHGQNPNGLSQKPSLSSFPLFCLPSPLVTIRPKKRR